MTPVARHTDPWTSHDAARSLGDLTGIQENILSLFEAFGPMTDQRLVGEYAFRFPVAGPSTIRTRRNELEKLGLVEVAGMDTTEGGRPCRRFRLAQSTLFPA